MFRVQPEDLVSHMTALSGTPKGSTAYHAVWLAVLHPLGNSVKSLKLARIPRRNPLPSLSHLGTLWRAPDAVTYDIVPAARKLAVFHSIQLRPIDPLFKLHFDFSPSRPTLSPTSV
jgi:hypothetical protein